MLLGVWSITYAIADCCTLYSVYCIVSDHTIGAAEVGVGSGCIMVACVRCSLCTCITYSSLSTMRCSYVFWDGIGSLTLDTRRNFTGTLFLPCIVCMCPITVALELSGYFRSCFVVKVGNVVRYTALITCSSVVIIGEKRDA